MDEDMGDIDQDSSDEERAGNVTNSGVGTNETTFLVRDGGTRPSPLSLAGARFDHATRLTCCPRYVAKLPYMFCMHIVALLTTLTSAPNLMFAYAQKRGHMRLLKFCSINHASSTCDSPSARSFGLAMIFTRRCRRESPAQ